ncbi:MAG TPA: hypothetical protein VLM40_06980 [Gemmata sp.]|nr:hypothetical protein [Gemmata sp.]
MDFVTARAVLLGFFLVVVGTGRSSEPDPMPADPPDIGLPVGKWKVEFANGVKEVCHIGNGGESTVEEPRRRSNGIAEVKGGSVVIRFHDDRIERWTRVGSRYVVEHWFPGSQLPTVTPVLGIAEPAP